MALEVSGPFMWRWQGPCVHVCVLESRKGEGGVDHSRRGLFESWRVFEATRWKERSTKLVILQKRPVTSSLSSCFQVWGVGHGEEKRRDASAHHKGLGELRKEKKNEKKEGAGGEESSLPSCQRFSPIHAHKPAINSREEASVVDTKFLFLRR